MLRSLLLTAAAAVPVTAPRADPASALIPYTEARFARDCRIAGGVPWFEARRAVCATRTQDSIVCDLGPDGVSGCKPDPTRARRHR